MNRRFFLAATAALALLSTTAAWADEDYVKELVRLLTKQGYGNISVTRTFLGRVRIIAVNSKGKRELICNPRTGEILRDVLIDPDGGMQAATENSGGAASSGRGGDSGDGDDNDDGPSGDGGGGDDNSGHGNSGSDDDGGGDNSEHGSHGDDD